jgi:hypothetical protein
MGSGFVANALMLEEDGHSMSLSELGVFTNEESALKSVVSSATAFIHGDDHPVPPVRACAP